MLLSKVIRPCNPQDLKPLQFRELGHDMPADHFHPLDQQPCYPEPEEACNPQSMQEDLAPEHQTPSNIDHQRELEAAFRQGREDAQHEAREQFGHASDMLAQALEEVSRLRSSLLQNSSNDMLRLVMSIVRQVLHAETSVNPQVIIETIGRALTWRYGPIIIMSGLIPPIWRSLPTISPCF